MKNNRFTNWRYPEFDKDGMTRWQWMCQNRKGLKLAKNTDIGAFTYINAKFGVVIEEDVQIGSHCSIYSESTIDDKQGLIAIKRGAKIGSHCIVMPNITIGANSVIGAHSFVTKSIPADTLALGVPAKAIKKLK